MRRIEENQPTGLQSSRTLRILNGYVKTSERERREGGGGGRKMHKVQYIHINIYIHSFIHELAHSEETRRDHDTCSPSFFRLLVRSPFLPFFLDTGSPARKPATQHYASYIGIARKTAAGRCCYHHRDPCYTFLC